MVSRHGSVRVAHVLSSLHLGGQERVALDLASYQKSAGWEVTALSLAPLPEGLLAKDFRAAGVAVETFEKRAGVDVALAVRVGLWMRGRFDLVHTHNPAALLYGAPAAALARIACVHTKHGANPRGGRRLMANRLAGRLVDAFVAVSPETAEVARKRNEVAESKLRVIANGIDLERFRPDPAARDATRAALGIDRSAWVVGTVGRLAVEKNQSLLLRAIAPLLEPDGHILLIGDGPLAESLSALAIELRVERRVHLLGARPDVPALLNALDVFALSSLTEGLPLVIPEAMATGLPVVSTAVGGIATVVEEGRTGFLVPTGDEALLRAKLAALQRDRELGRACGARGRSAAIARYTADRMRRDYQELYERILLQRAVGK
ncbi:glycosyltransferase [Labilithrix luteola]|nr:glycosyltransferase [Labilithrix luteola]